VIAAGDDDLDATVPFAAASAATTPARPRPTWGLQEGDELTPGRTVLARLGGGRTTEALLVWDETRLAIMVAKVLRPDRVHDPAALQAVQREAAALERLAHPVLVRGYDAELSGRFPHVLIEHLEGPTLRELLDAGERLPLEQALPLALHAAGALHYLACEGWVHLDVKPSNIVMGLPPRLIDLSEARPVADAARLAGPVGTDAYMAPEQCDPAGRAVSPAADVYGLGATLYHAVTGRRPYASAEGTRFPQLERDPDPLPADLPPALARAILAAMARDPARRPSARALAESLEPLVAALPDRVVLSRRRRR
jgi:eukaryotic-like serine/threonine-protein kinase